MTKVFRFLAMCAISVAFATLSIALAQTYTTVDFPGATATTLNGGPNPQGTNIGSHTTSGVTHGFMLKKGVFRSFDPPGTTSTTPNWISPLGVIVGGYVDAGGANHGFILDGGKFTTVDFPGAAGTILTRVNPSGEMLGESLLRLLRDYYPQFCSVQEGRLHQFRSTRRSQQQRQHGEPIRRSCRCVYG